MDELSTLRTRIEVLEQALRAAKRGHRPAWLGLEYLCRYGIIEGEACTCGAGAHNAQFRKFQAV